MQPKNCLFLCAWLALTASAQISNVGRTFTTSTQAVISYQAPDAGACTVSVREKGSSTLVHDFNPALFPGSDTDLTRPSSVTVGQRRIVVAGLRVAEISANNFRVSRALQADTEHDFTIVCGSSTHSGTFRTTNIPVGLAYQEPVPADPSSPGTTAWPEMRFGDRDQTFIDPQTGLLIRRLTRENDIRHEQSISFRAASGTNWTNPQSAVVDDASAATYSATTQDALFLELGLFDFFGGSRATFTKPFNQIRVLLNAWCQGGDCSTAPAADRSIEVCLTLDSVSCHSPVLTQELSNCTTSCNGASPNRYGLGDILHGDGVLSGWYPDGKPRFDHTSVYIRSGGVNRDGVNVSRAYGNYFDLVWREGSKIKIGSTVYTIASIQDEQHLTLESAPVGVENSVPFEASNFGVLIRKATTSTTPLVLQHATVMAVAHGGATYWDASGGEESYTNCSSQLVEGPGGEMGWHCHVSGSLLWIGKDSGNTSFLGSAIINPRSGIDGWPGIFVAPFWDKLDGNSALFAATDSSGDSIVVRARYRGNNTTIDSGPVGIYEGLKDCTLSPEPCWEITNLTPRSQNRSLRELVTQFHPDFVNFPNTGFKLRGPIGNSSRLLFVAKRDFANNDNLSFMAVFNVATGQVEAAGPSWKYWPARWSAVHGTQDTGDADWVIWALTFFRGPFTGSDILAGNGPYYSRVTSGPITATGEPCPARPSGSIIPADQWPTGNVCLTVGVDGEPGDPSPMFSSAGTVTVSGDVVTLTGADFPTLLTANAKMKVDGVYYQFTRTGTNTGTLSPQPVVPIVNSAYRLFHEEVDNPKTGTARREHAYLQDVEPGDVVCAEDEPTGGGTNGCGYFFRTEYFRVLTKTGNTWVLERGFNKKSSREQFFARSANAYLIMTPSACDLRTYPCAVANVYWNLTAAPLGMTTSGNAFFSTNAGNGFGHGSLRPIGEVYAVAEEGCPIVDGTGYSCYNSRIGNTFAETILSTDNKVFSGQPAFHGLIGNSVPNVVDSHPSIAGLEHPMFQNPGAVPRWFLDGRPFLGGEGVSGTASSPATPITGALYKFAPAQVRRMRRKILPTLASCGSHPLIDTSGPNSLIGGGSEDNYRYCVAERDGECRGDSQTGDIYFNCPNISTKYCFAGWFGGQSSDIRDVCIGDHGSLTMTLLQGSLEKRGMGGMHLRPLTKGFSQYRFVDIFWNAKTTPDGKWMLFRTMWADDYAHQALMAKLPPFPQHDGINRADFIPVEVNIPPPANADETHAVVEFGYGQNLFCTSRAEKCIKGAGAAEYSFEYENPAGVSCATGCKIW